NERRPAGVSWARQLYSVSCIDLDLPGLERNDHCERAVRLRGPVARGDLLMILYLSGSASSAAFLSDSAPYAIVGFILGSLLIRSARRRSEKRRAALEAKKSSLERRAELRRERLR